MKFDVPAGAPVSTRTGGYNYVWHCHILEHEEHDMMRPL
jgi:spore coat protein A, manganese oxidase